MFRRIILNALLVLATLPVAEAWADYSLAAFGDSITRGYPYYTQDANGIPNNGGYVPPLQSELNNANWGGGQTVTVYNWGHPGERIVTEGRARISEVLASKPDFVLVMEGTNDLPDGWGTGTVYHKLNATLNQIAGDGKMPVIGTLLPRYDKNSYLNSDIAYLNENLRLMAAGNPAHMQDLDYYGLVYLYNLVAAGNLGLADLETAQPAGHSWSSYMVDGLHPNSTGYTFLADEWFRALKRKVVSPMLYLLLLSD